MTSLNISIKREAYNFLKSLRKENESFSDVILKFKTIQKDKKFGIMKFFGVLKDADWENREKIMRSVRKSFEDRL